MVAALQISIIIVIIIIIKNVDEYLSDRDADQQVVPIILCCHFMRLYVLFACLFLSIPSQCDRDDREVKLEIVFTC